MSAVAAGVCSAFGTGYSGIVFSIEIASSFYVV